MTEHKFTDEEVIKSLKVCLEGDNCKECYINPHHGNYGYCTSLALKAALDLINRQKAEIAFWQDAAANAKKEAINEFADRLKKYYGNLNSNTAAGLVEYHIEQIKEEMLCEK